MSDPIKSIYKLKGTVEYWLRNGNNDIVTHGTNHNLVLNVGLMWMANRLFYSAGTQSAPTSSTSWSTGTSTGATASSAWYPGYPQFHDTNNTGDVVIAMALGSTGIASSTYGINGGYGGARKLVYEYFGQTNTSAGTTTWTSIAPLAGATGTLAGIGATAPLWPSSGYTITTGRSAVTTTVSSRGVTFAGTWSGSQISGSSLPIRSIGLFTSTSYNMGFPLCLADISSSNIVKGTNDTLDITWTIDTVE